MKKEVFAGLCLIFMFTGALVNIHFLTRLTDKIIAMVNEAEQLVGEGNWDEAAQAAEKAIEKWGESDKYTHLVLHHVEIDSVTDILYGLLKEIYSRNPEAVSGAVKLAETHLNGISHMEHIKLGSIF